MATEPIVLATSLAAHGSGAAVAEGMVGDDDTVVATTATPTSAAVMDLIDALLTICERFGDRKRSRIGGNRSPTAKRADRPFPHSATDCRRHRGAYEFNVRRAAS